MSAIKIQLAQQYNAQANAEENSVPRTFSIAPGALPSVIAYDGVPNNGAGAAWLIPYEIGPAGVGIGYHYVGVCFNYNKFCGIDETHINKALNWFSSDSGTLPGTGKIPLTSQQFYENTNVSQIDDKSTMQQLYWAAATKVATELNSLIATGETFVLDLQHQIGMSLTSDFRNPIWKRNTYGESFPTARARQKMNSSNYQKGTTPAGPVTAPVPMEEFVGDGFGKTTNSWSTQTLSQLQFNSPGVRSSNGAYNYSMNAGSSMPTFYSMIDSYSFNEQPVNFEEAGLELTKYFNDCFNKQAEDYQEEQEIFARMLKEEEARRRKEEEMAKKMAS